MKLSKLFNKPFKLKGGSILNLRGFSKRLVDKEVGSEENIYYSTLLRAFDTIEIELAQKDIDIIQNAFIISSADIHNYLKSVTINASSFPYAIAFKENDLAYIFTKHNYVTTGVQYYGLRYIINDTEDIAFYVNDSIINTTLNVTLANQP